MAEHPDHDYFETLDTNEALIQQWHGGANGRIQVWVGLEHMFYASPQAWKRAIDMSQRYQVGFHTHSNESRFDVEETQRRYGMRPIEALEAFGLLDAPHVLLAHCVWLSDHEIELLAQHHVGVAHNPVSNMKLASGAAPVEAMLASGIAVGLGTDGEKENNNLDMFEEMKTVVAAGEAVEARCCALSMPGRYAGWLPLEAPAPWDWRSEIGSIEVGKQADLIAVRTDTPRMTPLLTGTGWQPASQPGARGAGRGCRHDHGWRTNRR